MKPREQINDVFRLAFDYLRAEHKTSLPELATSIKVTHRHLQGIASSKERKGVTRKLAEKIAEHYGLSYDDMINLGRWIVQGSDPVLWVPGELVGPAENDLVLTAKERVLIELLREHAHAEETLKRFMRELLGG